MSVLKQVLPGVEFLRGKHGHGHAHNLAVQNLEGKRILLYFGSDFFPGCKEFTETLSHFYAKVKATKGTDFEIIYVSGDDTEEEYEKHYAAHPWPAIKFDVEKKLQKQLIARYKVDTFPALIVLDDEGNAAPVDAREMVRSKDTEGKKFPWI